MQIDKTPANIINWTTHAQHLENMLQIQTTQHITETRGKYRHHNILQLKVRNMHQQQQNLQRLNVKVFCTSTKLEILVQKNVIMLPESACTSMSFSNKNKCGCDCVFTEFKQASNNSSNTA